MKIYISRRQFKLLSILEKETSWINSEELGSLLNISYKTTQKEIHNLNMVLPDDWSIKIVNGLGYELDYPDTETVKFKFGVEERKLKYELIKLITDKQATSLSTISDELYASISTVHKLLNEINSELKKIYNLEIAGRPLQLKGNENAIRRLLYDKDYFVNQELHFHELFDERKNKLGFFLIEDIQLVLSVHSRYTLYLYLEVSIKRIKEGYEAEGIAKEQISTDLYKRIEPIFPFIENLYDVELSYNERTILYYAIIRSEFHLVESYAPDFFTQAEINDSTFLDFIQYLTELFNLDFKTSNSFMVSVFNIYYLNSSIVRSLKDKIYQDEDSFNKVINKYNLPLKEFERACDKWTKKHNFTFTRYTLTSILILIQKFNLTQTKVKILVVKSHSFILNDILLAELKNEFGSKVSLLPFAPSISRHFEIYEKNVDFVLTDVIPPDNFLTKPYIFISEHMTNHKLKMVHNMINSIMKEKEQLTIDPSKMD